MAAMEVMQNDRMKPKIPVSVLNAESGRVYSHSAAMEPSPMTVSAFTGVCRRPLTFASQLGMTPSTPYASRFLDALRIWPGSQE